MQGVNTCTGKLTWGYCWEVKRGLMQCSPQDFLKEKWGVGQALGQGGGRNKEREEREKEKQQKGEEKKETRRRNGMGKE